MNTYELSEREWMILYLVNGLKVEKVRTRRMTVWETGTGGEWLNISFRGRVFVDIRMDWVWSEKKWIQIHSKEN